MRLGRTVVVVVLVALAAPAAAGAHLRLGALAVDYRVRVTSPPGRAFTVATRQRDRSLRLTVDRGHRVLVLGYLGEPFLRIDIRGVAVNLSSPTAAAAGLVAKGARSGWATRSGPAVWRDPRLQRLPAGVQRLRWTIPLLVDGRRAVVAGVLQRVPSPALWPWLLVVLGSAAGGAALARPLRAGTAVLAGVATVAGLVAVVGPALDAGASGIRVATVYDLVFAAGGAGFALWGPREARVAAAGWLGLLALMVALACVPVFFHGAVLSALPGAVTRAAAAVAIGAGGACSVLAGRSYAREEPAEALAMRDSVQGSEDAIRIGRASGSN